MMITATCKVVNPLQMDPDDIDIRDIAHHLALCNRFNGATLQPLNVAHHSIWVSRLVVKECIKKYRYTTEIAKRGLQALLHDAAEAYLGDMIRPMKMLPEFTFFREIEDQLQNKIYTKFGLPTEMFPEVREADNLIVRFEASVGFETVPPAFMLPKITEEEKEHFTEFKSVPWTQAKKEFLTRFDNLLYLANR